VTGIAWSLLLASLHAYATGIFRKSPAKSLPVRIRAANGQSPAKARKAFQDFFELWKDADPDVPILQQAKAEYAKLR
jgi:hypothetical protein